MMYFKELSCKLYHKTTWFETSKFSLISSFGAVANYITKLRGLKLPVLRKRQPIVILVANYITKLRGLKQKIRCQPRLSSKVANYITKLRGLKPS